MRLYELIDFNPKKSNKFNVDYKNKVEKNWNTNIKGQGSFGTVYNTGSQKRLNQVIKVGTAAQLIDGKMLKVADLQKDGYLTYLYNIDKSGKGNPYFPVVHDLKVMRDPNGNIHYRANIEKLIDFQSQLIIKNAELMEALTDSMFGYSYTGDQPALFIIKRLEAAYRDPSLVKDPKLSAALDLIANVVSSNPSFIYDMYSSNVMWRMTGNIPQLVLSDPIA